MANLQPILDILPTAYRRALTFCDSDALEELRLRVGHAPRVIVSGAEEVLPLPGAGTIVSAGELEQLLLAATRQSAYAANETLKDGFLTLPGGHRVGVCASAVMQTGQILSMKHASSVAIRVARDVRFDEAPLLRALHGSTLLVGPPGSGKTTLLRGCIRALSGARQRVGVVDERDELAACVQGVPQFDLGAHTDVVRGIPKQNGMLLLLRCMNVHWIAVDEISAPEDLAVMRSIGYCGVKLLATVHASSRDELYRRPLYRSLMQMQLFQTLLLLSPDKHWHTEEVF